MKRIKNILFLITIVFTSCSTNGQQKKLDNKDNSITIEQGKIISIDGIDISEYEIDISNFYEIDPESINKNHLLCFAVEECDEELIRKVIEIGGSAGAKCGKDDLITGIAFCSESSLDLTKLLINHGASINGKDEENASFLSYAIGADDIELVNFLLKKGADKENKDTNEIMGCFPIHDCESLKMLLLLEKNGFDLNQTCENGENLLHFAAMKNLVEIAEYLITKKLTDVNQKNREDKRPIDIATKYKNTEIQNLLNK